MNIKKTIFKPGFLIPAAAVLLLLAGCTIYACVASLQNTIFFEFMGDSYYVKGSAEVWTDSEDIIRVTSFTEKENSDSTSLTIVTEGVSAGEDKVNILIKTYRYDYDGNIIKDSYETEDYSAELRVNGFKQVYNRFEDYFNGMEALLVFIIGFMLIIGAAFIVSIVRMQRTGDFSYTMVERCGVVIFCLICSAILIWKWIDITNMGFRSLNFKFIVDILLGTGKAFADLTIIPLALLSLALAVSNIWLVRHEGFRPQNLLGIFLGVALAAGIIFMRWLNNNIDYESSMSYYITTLLSIAFAFIYCYFECMLLSTMLCAALCTLYVPKHRLDYIIILGCAIRGDGTPTPLLRGRADRALAFERGQYERTGRHAVFVPSGGQGSDEVISEAESIGRYLESQGVPPERILHEDRSVNTYQNMAFSKKVIEGAAGKEDVSIGFATTNYHVFRGYTLANRVGMKVKGLSAKTKLYFFPNAFLREFIGLVWEEKLRHLTFIILLLAGLSGLYFIVDVL